MFGVGFGTRLFARGALWATRLFYLMGRQGPPLPEGPLLVVANHPNSIVDALVVFCVADRAVHPLARAPLFERPVIGQVLRELGGLPVYRPVDDPSLVGRNDATFDAAIAALAHGEAVLIFPEGMSHSEPELAPLKTGAARIALRAESTAAWNLGLAIVPVGLHYRRKTLFRGEVAALVGEPMRIAAWRRAYESDAVAAVHGLTATIAGLLEGVTLPLGAREDEALLDAGEALYAAERGLDAPGERDGLAERLPRLQLFAGGMNWLRAHDPPRLARLASAVRAYRARLVRLGLREGEVPPRQSALVSLQALGRDGLLALLGLPLVGLGIGAWYVPYMAPRVVLWLHRPAYEALATVKLVTALFAFPVVYVVWLVLAGRAGGAPLVVLAGLLLPLAGVATLHWREHWSEFKEELRFLGHTSRHRGLAESLRVRRRLLADEIDRVADEWEAETRRRLPERTNAR